MARVTARNTTLLVKDSTSASRTLSGRANSATLSFSSDATDGTAFGESYRFLIADGVKGWTLSMNGVWDGAASQVDEILYGILAACTSAYYGPGGSTTGAVQYSGCVILNTYEIAGALEGMVTWSAEFAGGPSLERLADTIIISKYMFGDPPDPKLLKIEMKKARDEQGQRWATVELHPASGWITPREVKTTTKNLQDAQDRAIGARQ